MLRHFIVDEILDKKYDLDLNYFLKVRNDIAHGAFSIIVNEEMIEKFSFLVIDLMSEIALIILEEFRKGSYLEKK